MGYLGRALSLDAAAGDLRAAATQAGSLRAAWTGLRSQVEMSGARVRVACIDGALAALSLGIRQGDASHVLDRVEVLLTEVAALADEFEG